MRGLDRGRQCPGKDPKVVANNISYWQGFDLEVMLPKRLALRNCNLSLLRLLFDCDLKNSFFFFFLTVHQNKLAKEDECFM